MLETYLKGVECPADIEKKIEEEYVQLNASIVEQKYDNDWIIQHLRVSEVGNKDENNEENKDGIKNKQSCDIAEEMNIDEHIGNENEKKENNFIESLKLFSFFSFLTDLVAVGVLLGAILN